MNKDNHTGTKKRITEERYRQIKIVLDNIPKYTKGKNEIHRVLGISEGTASQIKNSDNYADYKKKTTRKPAKPIVDTKEDKQPEPKRADVKTISRADNELTEAIMLLQIEIRELKTAIEILTEVTAFRKERKLWQR